MLRVIAVQTLVAAIGWLSAEELRMLFPMSRRCWILALLNRVSAKDENGSGTRWPFRERRRNNSVGISHMEA
jgi:hypothetical protein